MAKRKRSKRQAEPAPPTTYQQRAARTETLEDLLQLLQIPANGWDYLIVGDGSGVGWDTGIGCGWASTLVERFDDTRQIFKGGMDPGTVSLAEMMAFMQPLLYLASTKSPGANFFRVHIISDSQYVVNIGKGLRTPKSHAPLWRQLASFRALGFQMSFHWIPRDCVNLNKLADSLAGESRKAVSGVEVSAALTKLGMETVSDVNPFSGS